jgi:hypothetical protein
VRLLRAGGNFRPLLLTFCDNCIGGSATSAGLFCSAGQDGNDLVLVAVLGIDGEGHKHPLGLVESPISPAECNVVAHPEKLVAHNSSRSCSSSIDTNGDRGGNSQSRS